MAQGQVVAIDGTRHDEARRRARLTDVLWLKTRLGLWMRALELLIEAPTLALPDATTAADAWQLSVAELRGSGASENFASCVADVTVAGGELESFAEAANDQQARILGVAHVAADGIAPVAARIGRLAARLKFTALNGEIKAAQCGADGMAFQAITKELAHIAEVAVTQVKLLEEVSVDISALLRIVEREHENSGAQTSCIVERLGDAESNPGATLADTQLVLAEMLDRGEALGDSASTAISSLGGALAAVEPLLGAVKLFLGAVKHLESLGLAQGSVDDPLTANRASDLLIFAQKLGVLGATLFMWLPDEIEACGERVYRATEGVRGVLVAVDAAAAGMGALVSRVRAVTEPFGRLTQALRSGHAAAHGMERAADAFVGLAATLTKVAQARRRLDDIIVYLSNVRVLLRIEGRRLQQLDNDLSAQVRGTVDALVAAVAGMRDSVALVERELQVWDAEARARPAADRAHFDELAARMRRREREAHTALPILGQVRDRMTVAKQRADHLVTGFEERWEGVAEVVQQKNDVIDICERIEGQARAAMEVMTVDYGKVFNRPMTDPTLVRWLDDIARVVSRS